MTFVTRLMLVLLLPFVLMGCSYISTPTIFKHTDNRYLLANSIPPLRVPPGVSSDAFQNKYPVSYRNYPQSAQNVSLVPPGL